MQKKAIAEKVELSFTCFPPCYEGGRSANANGRSTPNRKG